MTFGELLALYRGKTGLTQKELADRLLRLITYCRFMTQG